MSRCHAVVAAVFVVVACDSDAKQEPSPAPVATTPAPDPLEPPGPPASVPKPVTGPLYASVEGKGIVELQADGTFALVPDSDRVMKTDGFAVGGPTPGRFQHTREGLMVVGFAGIERIESGGLKPLAPRKDVDAGFALHPQGHIFAVNGGLHEWDGTQWQTRPLTRGDGEPTQRNRSVAIDSSGQVWVLSKNGLHVRNQGKWSDVDLLKDYEERVEELFASPAGPVFASSRKRLFELDPGTTGAIERDLRLGQGFVLFTDATFSPSGATLAFISGGNPARYDTRTREHQNWTVDGDVQCLAPDETGRVWLGLHNAIVVVGPGYEQRRWTNRDEKLLRGRVVSIAVVSGGPTLPPP